MMRDDAPTYYYYDDAMRLQYRLATNAKTYRVFDGIYNHQLDSYAELDNVDHLCTTKCADGCFGSDCYCDGFMPAGGEYDDVAEWGDSEDGPRCLPAAGCRELCDSLPTCMGYSMDRNLPRCFLTTYDGAFKDAVTALTPYYDWHKVQTYVGGHASGTPCDHIS